MTKVPENIIKESYNSSNLKSSEYDVETKELIVEFRKGGKYSYLNVPLQTVISLKRALSTGSYFSKNISKNYKYKKIS
jgi:hypothetical protein|tara:strand:- start:1005 stop:1238 length:234 start_codon:yes stop_codon:yes gene_type:complete